MINLYQSTNENRKIVLREKLKTIKMGKTDSASGYLTKITNVRDALTAVGEVIPPIELVRITVNGLPSSWLNFVDGVCACETLPLGRGSGMIANRQKSKRASLGQPNQLSRMRMCW